ncbi:MAG: SurA N-terminal domain-containing protein [Lentisphaerae bacterium]|nr:SurA N-terminal domain-containing protein [Lentisphaerota bacterium]
MMFISRFNRLIRNKIVWSIFAFLVVLSFVAWQTQTGRSPREEADRAAATLDGKPIPEAEARSAYFNSYLYMTLMLGRQLKLTPRVDAALRHMAWRRLIALRGAQEVRLSAGPEEVVATIQQQPFLQDKGQFSAERYIAFVRQYLAGLRASENQFEEYIRQEILMTKARMMLAQATWVAPFEIEQIYRQLYDTFIVSYVMLTRDDLEPTVKVSDAEAQAYFTAHTNDFIIPEKMRVKFVSFPFERFLDEGAVLDSDLRGYYDEHIEEFTGAATGDLLSARSFEEVEDTLRDRLAQEAAMAAAGDQAADFEVTLAPDRQGQAPSFEAAASAAGLSVVTSALFSLKEPLRGLEAGLDFNRTAFSLRPTPEDYFSQPVRGSNAYYVLAFEERTHARLPDFAEVRSAARQAARAAALSNKLAQTATAIHQSAEGALRQGRTFAQAIRPFSLEVITTEPFTLRTGADTEDEQAFYELAKKIMFLNAGELTEVIVAADGIIIGHVDSRVTADRTLLESIKNDLAQYLRQRREDLAFREWQEYLLVEHKFALAAAQPKVADEEEPEEPDEDDDGDGGQRPDDG